MKRKTRVKASESDKKFLRDIASSDHDVARAALKEMAVALELPLREGVMSGDIVPDWFEVVDLDGGDADFPLHFLSPGTEKDHVAYSIPNHGYIPQRHVEGDYVKLAQYDIGNAIDTNIKYAKKARWDVAGDMMEVLMDGYKKKINDDIWHTVLSAGYDRNLVAIDSDASAGQFSKRLVSVGKTTMRRNGGGNSASNNRSFLTDLYLSVEGVEDIRNWNVDQVDDLTRREIMVSPVDGGLSRIFQVNLHALDELGEEQEYNNFFLDELSGTLPSDKVELAVGVNAASRRSFVMSLNDVEVHPDDALLRHRRFGWFSWIDDLSCGVLDGRDVLLLAF